MEHAVFGILNSIIAFVGNGISGLINLLPHSPFTYLSNSKYVLWLGYLDYLLPVSYIVSVLQAWIVAIGLFYCYQFLARWLKVVAS